jgi:hypothetical protein
MRAALQNDILLLHCDDVPQYKKGGSQVRNTYFWSLKSIAGRSRPDRDWEYEAEVWLALQRMLSSFQASGYLPLSETQLEFPYDAEIPAVLRPVSTRYDAE